MAPNMSLKKPRTLPPEQRRHQLIEATITSISKAGISGTTLTAVTKEAGLSLGLVNFHFKTKDILLAETLSFLAEEHRAISKAKLARPGLDAREKLMAIVNAQFDPRVCSRKKLAVWFAFFGEAAQRKSYRATSSDIDTERQAVCARLFCEVIEAENHQGVNAKSAARTLEGLFDGFWLNMLMYPSEFTREDAILQVTTYLAILLPTKNV